MKVTGGFISNSSTSSFIIYICQDEQTDFLDKVIKSFDTAQECISTQEQLQSRYEDRFGWLNGRTFEQTLKEEKEEGEYWPDEYKRDLERIEEGKRIYVLDLEYEGAEIFERLCDNFNIKYESD